MSPRFRSLLLTAQAAVVAVLFAGAILAIWRAGGDVVAREGRRSESLKTLAKADDALAIRGARALDHVPDWPDTLEPEEWVALDEWLAKEAASTLKNYPGIGGGYFVPSTDRYLGHAGATRSTATTTRRTTRLSGVDLPPRERDMIDDLVMESIARERPVDRVVEMPPDSVAVRASPLRVNGRRVAAIWLLARLDDPAALGRSVRAYQLASGLALGGLALASVVAVSLARSIRRHVADRERMERDLRRGERLAAIGALLAGVSHEMRNPLAGIRSAAQLWQRGIVTDDELSTELIGEVDRLDAIIGNLLMFSRADPKQLAPGDVNAVVSEAARLCRVAAERQGVTVDLDLAPSAIVEGLDPPALLQVLRNLTANALDAMPDGGRLGLSTRDAASGRVEILVGDTGQGLSDDVLTRLFDPFYTTKPQGTGLGLAIAREIVLAHRGEILARNRKAGGAELVITLPGGGRP